MALLDVMGKAGAQDPGPKKHRGAFSWDQMRLWNKYAEKNSGKSVDEIFNIMAKENPDVTKGMTIEKLKGAFDEQSTRAYVKEMNEFKKKKESGYFNSDEWKAKKAEGYDENWEPQYRSINQFIPAQYMSEKGEAKSLGLSNEFGEFENPDGLKIGKGGPIKSDISRELPNDVKLADVEQDDQYEGFVSYMDPQEGRIKYVTEDQAAAKFGTDWHNKLKSRRDQAAADWEKLKAEILDKQRQKQGK